MLSCRAQTDAMPPCSPISAIKGYPSHGKWRIPVFRYHCLESPIILSWLYLGINRVPYKCIPYDLRKNLAEAESFLHVAQFCMKNPAKNEGGQNKWSDKSLNRRREQQRFYLYVQENPIPRKIGLLFGLELGLRIGEIWVFWSLLWVQTQRRSCAFRHWTTQWLLIRLCTVQLFIPTAVLSVQAICTAEQSHDMVSGKAWIVQTVAAMTMLAAKVCGTEWRQNYYTIATTRNSWPWSSWNRWSGDTLWVIGTTAAFAPPMVAYTHGETQ